MYLIRFTKNLQIMEGEVYFLPMTDFICIICYHKYGTMIEMYLFFRCKVENYLDAIIENFDLLN